MLLWICTFERSVHLGRELINEDISNFGNITQQAKIVALGCIYSTHLRKKGPNEDLEIEPDLKKGADMISEQFGPAGKLSSQSE